MAKPTVRGGMPRPPVKLKARVQEVSDGDSDVDGAERGDIRSDCWVCEGGKGAVGSKRGVERKMNHRLLKVPMWKARRKCERRVKSTLLVKMRRKGSFCLERRAAERGVGGVMGVVGVRDSRS